MSLRELESELPLSDEMADWEQGYFLGHRQYYEDIIRRINDDFSPETILKIGSVPCHLTYLLSDSDYQVVGLNLDPDRYRAAIEEHRLTVHECDIERDRFPLEDDAVSFVLFSEVFEHLRVNPVHTLEEISRVLEPGGDLLLTTPNGHFIEDIFQYLTGNGIGQPYKEFQKLDELGHMGHINHYTTSQVCEFLEGTGFEVTDVEYDNWHKTPGNGHSLKEPLGRVLTQLVPQLRRYQIIYAKKT